MTMTAQQKASRGPEAIASIDTAFDRTEDMISSVLFLVVGCLEFRGKGIAQVRVRNLYLFPLAATARCCLALMLQKKCKISLGLTYEIRLLRALKIDKISYSCHDLYISKCALTCEPSCDLHAA